MGAIITVPKETDMLPYKLLAKRHKAFADVRRLMWKGGKAMKTLLP